MRAPGRTETGARDEGAVINEGSTATAVCRRL